MSFPRRREPPLFPPLSVELSVASLRMVNKKESSDSIKQTAFAGADSYRMTSLKGVPAFAGMTWFRRIKEIPASAGTNSYRMTSLKEVPAFAGSDSYRMTSMRGIKEIPAFAGADSYRMTSLKEVPAFAGMTSMRGIKEIPASAGIAMRNPSLAHACRVCSTFSNNCT